MIATWLQDMLEALEYLCRSRLAATTHKSSHRDALISVDHLQTDIQTQNLRYTDPSHDEG